MIYDIAFSAAVAEIKGSEVRIVRGWLDLVVIWFLAGAVYIMH